jgi:hypothetical protein
MGIQINGQTDIISAVDGGLTISGAELPTVTNLNATGIVTATGFVGNVSGNLSGNLNSTGVSTVTTLRATSIVGVTTAGITTAYVGSINDGPISGARNRIINGDMRIDQRNAGAAVTINSTANTYTLDRWFASGESTDGVFTVDQTTDAPAGFTNSTRITTTTADASIGSTQIYLFRQSIEGNNIYDLAFGTASAKAITISFWVRSSLTGTFGGALNNSVNDRNYPFTYSISAANTWEYKTISVAGDTTGTWLTDTGRGITLTFQIGAGSSRVAAAGGWTGTSNIYGATGATNVIGTLNATWDITGVQLEPGTVATPFERRSYGQELALCERYYQKLLVGVTVPGAVNTGSYTFTTPFRAVPRTSSTGIVSYSNISYSNASSLTCTAAGTYGFQSQWTSTVNGFAGVGYADANINAEL